MKKSILRLTVTAAFLIAYCLPALAGGGAQNPAPEPSTILLVASAGGALLVIRQLRRKK